MAEVVIRCWVAYLHVCFATLWRPHWRRVQVSGVSTGASNCLQLVAGNGWNDSRQVNHSRSALSNVSFPVESSEKLPRRLQWPHSQSRFFTYNVAYILAAPCQWMLCRTSAYTACTCTLHFNCGRLFTKLLPAMNASLYRREIHRSDFYEDEYGNFENSEYAFWTL
jgi:hypothetical protein